MLFCPTACFAYFSSFFHCFCCWTNKSLYKAFKEWDRAMFIQLELERERRPRAFWCVIVCCVSWSWGQWYRQGLERKPRKDPNTSLHLTSLWKLPQFLLPKAEQPWGHHDGGSHWIWGPLTPGLLDNWVTVKVSTLKIFPHQILGYLAIVC